LEIISVSDSVTDLFGFNRSAVVCQPFFLQERVAAEDRLLFSEKVSELETSGSIAFMHRFVVASGVPVWVCHSLSKLNRNAESLVNGCLVPIGTTPRLLALEQEVVSRFIHKLGNHFQLLSLVFSSLKSSLSHSREIDVLEETLGKAIDLTRVFSECNQVPSWVSDVQLLEIMKAAAESRINEFAASGVRLQIDLANIPDDATIMSSPYLLEAAFGHVLQNALEATGNGGTVEFGGRLVANGSRSVARLYVKDTGCGIPARQQHQVIFPFFTTKRGRDGLGLMVASRFVEMHGGALQIESREGEGTEIAILLPLERGRDVFCA
jgi:signal transduction histidine kinase